MARSLRLLLLGVLALRAHAQDGTPATRLVLRPHAGDTLRVRLDQTIESSRGTRPNDTAERPGDVASLTLLARIIVESADAAGATAMAHADSVRVTATGTLEASPTLRAARALQGQHFRFRIAPDGGTSLAADANLNDAGVSGLLSQLPATLPTEAMVPGTSWVRAVSLPLATLPDGRSTATLNATFRFDSLAGDYAYLSVRGRLVRSGPLPGIKGGFVQTAGDVTGKILLDLRRGWIADARSAVTLQSLVTGDGAATQRVRVRITQWMRVM
ncbi:MAG: hypothetical protein JNL26_02520 [Gemmatimonadetes bacterium]|nr:hypothetical protein [Gemmatimonadota bacterium]